MYIYIYTSLQHIICGWFPLVLPGAARATERIPCFFRAWARIDLAPCVGFVAVSTAVVFLTVFKNWDGWLERVGTQCFHTHTYVHIHMHIPAYTWTYIYIYTHITVFYIYILSYVYCVTAIACLQTATSKTVQLRGNYAEFRGSKVCSTPCHPWTMAAWTVDSRMIMIRSNR